MNFIRNNKKRIIALIVFILIIVFNGMNDPVSEEAIKPDKSVTSFGSFRKSQDPIMEGVDNSELYEKVFSAQSGDFYRLIFVAKSAQDDKINVFARSFGGDKKKIGELDLVGGDNEKYFEIVFGADREYQDIYLEREGNKESDFLDNRIFVYDFSISRLKADSRFDLSNIDETIFGETEITETFLFEKFSKNDYNIFSKSKKKLKEEFVASEDNLLFVDLNLEKVGMGGVGKYGMELVKLNEKGERVSNKPVKKIGFSSKNLGEKAHEGGFYRFEFQVELEKGTGYRLDISNSGVEMLDDENYIKLNAFSPSEDQGSYIRLITAKNKEYEGRKVLTGAKIEDLGTGLIYEYKNNHYITDWSDVFDGDDFDFDWYKDTVMGKGKKGSYFTYKINTLYPFEQMRIKAEQYGSVKDEIEIAYSYDNSTWEKIDYTQEKEEPQIFDYQIVDNKENNSEIYIRASYDKKKSDSGKQSYWGLQEFEISAYLTKEENE